MAVFNVSVTIGSTGDFSTISTWNTSLSGYNLVDLTNNPDYATSTAYTVGDLVVSSASIYFCSSDISSSTTGPSGTGTGITDNDGTWDYVCVASGNKIIYEGRIQQQLHNWFGTDVLGSGVTMDGEGYVLLTTDIGASFRDYPSNALKFDTSYDYVQIANHNGLNITVSQYSHVRGVQFEALGKTRGIILNGTIYQSILKNNGTIDGAVVGNVSSTGLIVNCLLECGTGATSVQGLIGLNGFGNVYYCTLVQPTDDPSSSDALLGSHTIQPNLRIINNAFFGGTNALNKGGGGTATTTQFDYNASDDDGTGFTAGGNNLYSQSYTNTAPFVQAEEASGLDFKIVSGSVLAGTAADLSGSGIISASEDIFGNSRDASTPCIGCYEIQSGLAAYELTADLGTFTLTGINSSILTNRNLAVDVGEIVLTGVNASLSKGFTLSTSTGEFILTGITSNFKIDRRLAATVGELILSGQSTNLRKGFAIAIEAGIFNLTGNNAYTLKGFHLDGVFSNFALSGISTNLLRGFRIGGENQGIVLTGNQVDLLAQRMLQATTESFSLSGQTSSLLRGFVLNSETAQYDVAGQIANLLRGLILPGETGNFEITGITANLLRGILLLASTGNISVTGQMVGLPRTYRIPASKGTFTFDGIDVELDTTSSVLAAITTKYLSGIITSPISMRGEYDLQIIISGQYNIQRDIKGEYDK